jgi:hypothetical protein
MNFPCILKMFIIIIIIIPCTTQNTEDEDVFVCVCVCVHCQLSSRSIKCSLLICCKNINYRCLKTQTTVLRTHFSK